MTIVEMIEKYKGECIDITEYIFKEYVPSLGEVEEFLQENNIPYEVIEKKVEASRYNYYTELAIFKTPFGYLHCAAEWDAAGNSNCLLLRKVDKEFWQNWKLFNWIKKVD